jgi:hypothetical protein
VYRVCRWLCSILALIPRTFWGSAISRYSSGVRLFQDSWSARRYIQPVAGF